MGAGKGVKFTNYDFRLRRDGSIDSPCTAQHPEFIEGSVERFAIFRFLPVREVITQRHEAAKK